jgi:hypothetical protein
MKNPTIDELRSSGKYELVAELNHLQIKEFVIEQLTEGGKMVRIYMIYQLIMSLLGLFFITRSIALALHSQFIQLYVTLATLLFSFTLLIAIHEALHGIALKLTGASRVHFGGYFNRFVFYAEADQHVLNRKQFTLLALSPLVVVQVITVFGVILWFSHPALYFFTITMAVHSLFCAGDIGLLALLNRFKDSEIYTFDVKVEKKAYYYIRK